MAASHGPRSPRLPSAAAARTIAKVARGRDVWRAGKQRVRTGQRARPRGWHGGIARLAWRNNVGKGFFARRYGGRGRGGRWPHAKARRRVAMDLGSSPGRRSWCRNVRFPRVDLTGHRNTLVFQERWSASHGLSQPDMFHQPAEVRDLGSLAARRVDEFDWSEFRLELLFYPSADRARWRFSSCRAQAFEVRVDLGGARRDLAGSGSGCLSQADCVRFEAGAIDDQPGSSS